MSNTGLRGLLLASASTLIAVTAVPAMAQERTSSNVIEELVVTA